MRAKALRQSFKQYWCKRNGACSFWVKAAQGNVSILALGLLVASTAMGFLAVDLPLYFTAQNQLQTAVNAAALAGAGDLPYGTAQAQQAAYNLAAQNPVLGIALKSSDLTVTTTGSSNLSLKVIGKVNVPTVLGKFLCAFSSTALTQQQSGGTTGGVPPVQGSQQYCLTMPVAASAKAVPAARDTMLVIDNSSSMNSLGNNRPMKDVLSAAQDYVSKVALLNNESVDRVGLVKFAYDATLVKGLTSSKQDPSFTSLKNAIKGITIYSAQGWNTNYEAPLKMALNELETNGRKNATKLIVFMTDGLPNLPAPPTYYTYSNYQPYNKCVDMVNSSLQIPPCWRDSKGKKVCPVLPDSRITTAMIPTNAYNCATDYTNYLTSSVQSQVQRAKTLDVTIHTLQIWDGQENDNATSVLRRMIKNERWSPDLLNYMANNTKGQQYTRYNYDAVAIASVYQTIAGDIRMKLAN
jgi:hypothetical protein